MSRELQAGRELDALIAEKVMGWVVRTTAQIGVPGWREGDFYINKPDAAEPRWGHMLLLPHYSTDIRAAWEVVERLDALQIVVRIENADREIFDVACMARADAYAYDPMENAVRASANSAPLAICRAALLAVGRPAPSPGDTPQ